MTHSRFRLFALAASLVAAPAFAQTPPAAPPKAPPAAPAKAPPAAPATPVAPAAPSAPPPPVAPVKSAPQLTPMEFTGQKPTAGEVFVKHFNAIGGEAAWKDKKTIHAKGTMKVPSAGIEGAMDIQCIMPNRMTMVIELPNIGTTRAGFDGTTGWAIDPMRGPTILGEKEVADFIRQADFMRDRELAKNPGASEVVGLAKFGNHTVWNVKVVEPDGKASSNYYDRDSGLMVGGTMKTQTQMGEIPITMEVEKYSEFGNVKVPSRTVMWMMMQSQEIDTNSIEWNTLDESAFALPKEIVALVKAREAAPPAAPAGGTGTGTGPGTGTGTTGAPKTTGGTGTTGTGTSEAPPKTKSK